MSAEDSHSTLGDLANQNSRVFEATISQTPAQLQSNNSTVPLHEQSRSYPVFPEYSLVGSRCPIDSEIQNCQCYKTICRKHASSTQSLSSLDNSNDLVSGGKNGSSQNNTNHCHDFDVNPSNGIDTVARKKLIMASILCFVFMLGEIIGGYMAHSLAIMTDAAHLLTDFASFMISLLAIYLAARPPSKQMSFGWYRAEVMGAFVSVLMIWLVTGILVYMAIMRIVHGKYHVDGKIMLITSVVGVVVNIVMAGTLHQYGHGHSHGGGGGSHGHSHGAGGGSHSHGAKANGVEKKNQDCSKSQEEGQAAGVDSDDGDIDSNLLLEKPKENINVRAAFIHVIGDLLQSVGVMIAAIVIYCKPELKIADPICTFIFSVLVLFTTINILRDALQVLMEGTPRGLDFNEVKSSLYEIPGVVEVHNLRMWSLTTTKTAVSVHIALTEQKDSARILRVANRLLRRRFMIKEVTIQLEQFVPEMVNCRKCQEH